ncbi:MAG: hypothetical protein HY820_05605 [Acidobacteria bacterium]|nr:hypothetical protein [Acidobacteriota bacterium]
MTLISESDFGIHDISRTQLSESGLPRFNMPFELGLYLGCIRFGGRNHESKRALVLDSEAYRYQQYLSDLAGNDPDAHHNDAAVVIEKVRGWLQSVCEEQLPGPVHIRDSYRYFEQAYPAMAGARGLATGAVPYSDVVYTMREWMTSYVLGRRVGG